MGLLSSFKQTASAAPAASSDAETVRRADIIAVPAGAGWHAVCLRGAPEGRLWPSIAVDFLAACSDFKPLSEHLGEYALYHSLESTEVREISHWAGKMIEAGLLFRASKLARRCAAAGPGNDEPVRIEAIGIPSAGREDQLRRVITTFGRNAREYGRSVEITVSVNGRARNAPAVIADLARAESVKITLIDDGERSRQAAALAQRAGVDPAIASFALSDGAALAQRAGIAPAIAAAGLADSRGAGFVCGANRNALLLRHAGRPFLSLDDDMVCELTAPPGRASPDGLTVFSSNESFQRWFYPEYAQTFEGRRSVVCDYIALHESMLGRSVGSFFAGEPEFIGITDDLLRRLQETEGRIITTFTGHYGHPGIPTAYYYLSYRGESLERLTGQGEEKYRAYLRSAGVCALRPRMSIADTGICPGMALGIDARAMLPPFPPFMHAEDYVWGAALWQCCASGFSGHLPLATRHDPGIGRGLIVPPFEGSRPVAMWEFAHLLRGMVLGWVAPAGELDTAARMDSLGRHLCDLAGSPAEDFREFLRCFVLQHESDKIGYLEYCVAQERDAPDFWQRDVDDYIEQTRLALAEPDFDIPFDMRDQWPAPDARAMMQRFILEYGRLLRAWPALVAAV